MIKTSLDADFDVAYKSPIGWLGLKSGDEKLSQLAFLEDQPAVTGQKNAALEASLKALENYFAGERDFSFPDMFAVGTDFQKRVWRQLSAIPYGETLTYGEEAKRLDTHPRAVGGACRANPLVVLVPCHRVVSASGLGGFSGHATGHWPRVKNWLLHHEGVA